MRNGELSIPVGLALVIVACAPERVIRPPDSSYTPMHVTLVIGGASEAGDAAQVTREFFTAGNVKAYLGRFFVDQEYEGGITPVAVISHRYWTERFGAAPTVIGSQVLVNDTRTVIVGVAPPTFQPERAGSLWIPKRGSL